MIQPCYITNLTGQIFPVKEVCRLGRERGIEVIVDGAHVFPHFPFTQKELDSDYYGTSLHKSGAVARRSHPTRGVWRALAGRGRWGRKMLDITTQLIAR